MKNSNLFNIYKNIIHLTQFGFSVAFPLVAFLWGASWLVNDKGVGGWVYAVAIIVGLLVSACSFISFLQYINRKNNQGK